MASSMRGIAISAALLVWILTITQADGKAVGTHTIVKRTSLPAKVIQFRNGSFSDCTGGCSAAARTRSVLCSDQDGIVFPFCDADEGITEDCCEISELFSLLPIEICTPVGCANDVTNFPSTIDNTNGDGSTTSGTATLGTVSLTTMEANNGGTSTFTLGFSSPGVVQSVGVNYQSPVTEYGITIESGTQDPIFTINGESVLTISMLCIREAASCDVVSYEPSLTTISLSDPGIPSQFLKEGITEYWYIDPVFGRAYQFTNNKVTFETGAGILFVNTVTDVAVFSQRSSASELILRFVSRTFRVEVIDNSLSLRLQLSRIFPLSGTIEIEHMNEIIYYTGGSLVTNTTSVAANNLIVFGNNGFEALVSAGETVIPIYSDIYFNAVNSEIFVCTNSMFSDLISGWLVFLQSNTPQDGVFMVSGEYVTYQGVNIMRLTNMTTTSVSSSATILYSGNSLFGSQTIGDVFFVMFQAGGEITVSASSSEAPIFFFTGATIYISEGRALVTDSQQTQTLVADALNDILNPSPTTTVAPTTTAPPTTTTTTLVPTATPVFPTIPPDLVTFMLIRRGILIYLQLNSDDVLQLPLAPLSFNTEETIMYNDGTLSFSSTTITDVTSLTVVSDGQSVVRLSPPLTGYSKDIDSSYFLYSNGGFAVLTNQTDLINLIDSSITFVSIVTLQGQQFLYIGDLQVIRLNNIRRIELTSFQDIIAVTGGVIFVSADGMVLFNEAVDNFVVYRNSDAIPLEMFMMAQPILGPGSFYVNEADSRAFYTDRSEIIGNIMTVFEIITIESGQTVFRINGMDVIILNGALSIGILADEQICFQGSQVRILDSNNAELFSFDGVNSFITVLDFIFMSLTGPDEVCFDGPMTLFYQQRLGSYFITNTTTIINSIQSQLPIPSQSVSVSTDISGVIVTIGSQTFIINDVSDVRDIATNEQVEYTSSVLTVTVSGSTVFTLGDISQLLVYLLSDFTPRTFSNSGPNIAGLGRLYYNTQTNQAMFTDRLDVTDAIENVVQLEVGLVIRSGGEAILTIGGQEIITVNEFPMIDIAVGQLITYDGNTVIIRDAVTNAVIQMFSGITMFTRYSTMDTAPQTITSGTITPPIAGRLVRTPTMAFFTNRDDVLTVLNIDISLVVRSRIIDGETVLNIGNENIIQLTGSRRFVVTSNQRIEYSGNTIIIRDITTNEIIQTFTNIGSSYRYSQSNDIPELDTGGGITVIGPITIIISNDTTLITDRSEVLNVVDTVIPPPFPPSQMFRIVERSDGSFVLVINRMDIITISDAMKQIVESTEQLSYTGNTITITNFISGDELNMILATTLVIYRDTDFEPLNFTGNAPNVYNGPFTLCYTPDGVAFFTNRQDIVMLILDTLVNITTPSPTTATTTPTPDIFPSTQTIIIINSDGSRWFTREFSSCSRICGVGVRVRIVECLTESGGPSLSCTNPREPTSRNIPASLELCNTLDCPLELPRNGIPRDEIIEFDFDSNFFDGRITVIISDSSVAEESYDISIVALGGRFGSAFERQWESVGGQLTTGSDIDLRLGSRLLESSAQTIGREIQIIIEDNYYIINPLPRDSVPGDECFMVSSFESFTYQSNIITFDSNTFSNIPYLIRFDEILSVRSRPIQSVIVFPGSLPVNSSTSTGPGILCVSQENGIAFFSNVMTLTSSVYSMYNDLITSFAPPVIMPSTSTVLEITESGSETQIGYPAVSARQDIYLFTLRCQLVNPGNPPVEEYIWTRNDYIIPNNNVKYSIVGDALTIKNLVDTDAGNYTCTVANPVGSDSATTELFITQRPVFTIPTDAPTDPPPPPSFYTLPFTECSRSCGVGIRVRVVLCQEENGVESQECSEDDIPLLYELCNVQDCPNESSQNGIPRNEVLDTIIQPIFNGDVRINVNVTNSNNASGTYDTTIICIYPDGTRIEMTVLNAGGNSSIPPPVLIYGEPLFGRLDAIRTGNRIDIIFLKILFSILPSKGDQCFLLNSVEQFLYSDNSIISAFLSQGRFSNINFLLGVENSGIFSYYTYANRVFQGPLLLCVNSLTSIAFYTTVPSLRDITWMQYIDILTNFSAPVIFRPNETTIVIEESFQFKPVILGENVEAPNGAQLTIEIMLSEKGVPPATDVVWKKDGEIIEMDAGKGVFFTADRMILLLQDFVAGHVGMYTATVSNPAGSDSHSTSVTLVPSGDGIIISAPSSTLPQLEVGIGLSYIENRNVYTSTRVTCSTTSPADVTFLVNGSPLLGPDITLTSDPESNFLIYDPAPDGCTFYTCEAIFGQNITSENSIVCLEDFQPPNNIIITGDTSLSVGESTVLSCTADGPPEPTVMFNEIRLGSNGIFSEFRFLNNGSLAIDNAIYGDDSLYCCQATNEIGTASACVSVTLVVPPMIAQPFPREVSFVSFPPGSYEVMVGQMVIIPADRELNIRCNVTEGSPDPSIQWFFNFVPISTEQGPVLTLEDIVVAGSGEYECRATNIAGVDSETSLVTVVVPPTVLPSNTDVSEVITNNITVTVKQTSELFVINGLTVCLRCDFDPGMPPADTVVWLRDDMLIDLRDSCLDLGSDDGSVLCIEEITRPYSAEYSCRVSNLAGSDTGGIDVTVPVYPRILSPDHPMVPAPGFCDDQTDRSFVEEDVGVGLCVSTGTDILIHCQTDGLAIPDPDIIWSYRANNMVLDILPTQAGITLFPNNSLLISQVSSLEGVVGGPGIYMCSASNLAGIDSKSTSVNVSGEPVVINRDRVEHPIMGRRRIVNVGSARQTIALQKYTEVQILCNADGRPTPEISWQVNGSPVDEDNELFNIMDDGSLLLIGLKTTDCTVYTCTASNAVNTVSESVTVCGEKFFCEQIGFQPCSVTCGRGARSAILGCVRQFDGSNQTISISQIPSSLRPRVEPEPCIAAQACPVESYAFVLTEFSECSRTCGGGRQTRDCQCYLHIDGEPDERVAFEFCLHFAENQTIPGPLTRECNTFSCPEWRVGDFGECSETCGQGIQTREVVCIAPDNNNNTIADEFCTMTKPETTQRCNLGSCPYVYRQGAWGDCSTTCEGGIRTRSVTCYNVQTSENIDDSFCEGLYGDYRPDTTQICGVGDCPAAYVWSPSNFGSCSAACGTGVQTRTIQCVSVFTHEPVSDDMCEAGKRPTETRGCFIQPCPDTGVVPCEGESGLCSIVASLNMCSLVTPPTCCLSC